VQPEKKPTIPKGDGNLLDGLKNDFAAEERVQQDDEEKIIRVMNAKNKVIPIRFDQVKQSLRDLKKLNAIPSNKDDGENPKKAGEKNFNPIICLRTLVS
jgi:hypothetical protein